MEYIKSNIKPIVIGVTVGVLVTAGSLVLVSRELTNKNSHVDLPQRTHFSLTPTQIESLVEGDLNMIDLEITNLAGEGSPDIVEKLNNNVFNSLTMNIEGEEVSFRSYLDGTTLKIEHVREDVNNFSTTNYKLKDGEYDLKDINSLIRKLVYGEIIGVAGKGGEIQNLNVDVDDTTVKVYDGQTLLAQSTYEINNNVIFIKHQEVK